MGRSMQVCDRNCFECKYDDCILEVIDAEDYRLSAIIEEYANPKSKKELAIAAYKREYRRKKKLLMEAAT